MKRESKRKPLTLSPVGFEEAIAAALETPPERKPKEKVMRAKKRDA